MAQYSLHTLQIIGTELYFFFINSNIFIVQEKDIEQNSKT